MPQPVRIVLNDEEMAEAVEVGNARRDSGEEDSRSHVFAPTRDARQQDIDAAVAERAVVKYTGLRWTGKRVYRRQRVAQNPDVGKDIQVRAVTEMRHRLMFRPRRDNPDHKYVLVFVDGAVNLLRGWMLGRNTMRDEWSYDDERRVEAYRVSAVNLEDMAALLEEPIANVDEVVEAIVRAELAVNTDELGRLLLIGWAPQREMGRLKLYLRNYCDQPAWNCDLVEQWRLRANP